MIKVTFTTAKTEGEVKASLMPLNANAIVIEEVKEEPKVEAKIDAIVEKSKDVPAPEGKSMIESIDRVANNALGSALRKSATTPSDDEIVARRVANAAMVARWKQ